MLGFVRGLQILPLAVILNLHAQACKTDDLIPVLKKIGSKIITLQQRVYVMNGAEVMTREIKCDEM